MLGRAPERIELSGCAPVVANGSDLGYYRVQYDAGASAQLRKAYASLAPAERTGLIADALALVRAGRSSIGDYLGLLEQVRNEREAAIWLLVIEQLTYLDETFVATPTQARLHAYASQLLAPVLARLDWKPRAQDDPNTLRARDALIAALGRFEHRPTIERARKLYAVEKAGQSSKAAAIPPSIRPGVIQAAARHADPATFERLRTQLRQANDQEENYMYGRALLGMRDPKLVERVLQLTLGDEWPPNSASYYAVHIGMESGQNELARAFVVKNFDRLAGKTSDWRRLWLLPDTYEGFAEVKRADELIAEQKRHLGDYALGPASKVAALIRERASMRTRQGSALDAWLRPRVGPAHAPGKQMAATP
jgi:aminopeptidase N